MPAAGPFVSSFDEPLGRRVCSGHAQAVSGEQNRAGEGEREEASCQVSSVKKGALRRTVSVGPKRYFVYGSYGPVFMLWAPIRCCWAADQYFSRFFLTWDKIRDA